MNKQDLVYVAGHRGLVGSALCRALVRSGYERLLVRTHGELDLCDQSAVNAFFERERPDVVLLSAARVGGIQANATQPAIFIHENLQIQTNVIHAAWRNGVRKLLFLGSSCIYPRLCPQPIREEYLLTGPLESTNEPYALAKIAGIRMCQAYRKQYGFDAISVMPTNLYGPGDNYDPENSHVLPALIRRIHEAGRNGAPEVTIWGTGTPRREFLHVDDMAEACVFLLERYSDFEHVNIGCGTDLTIMELAQMVAEVCGYRGRILTDPSKPDGTPRKLLDISKILNLGWKPRISLRDGLCQVYREYTAAESSSLLQGGSPASWSRHD